MTGLTIGTRGSRLAVWQAEHVAALLREKHLGLTVTLKRIRTTGDRVQDKAFGELSGKGFFVKELEAALLRGEVDLAVHSLKDVPTELPEGLELSAVLERHEPWDALVTRDGGGLESLPEGATIGTGSFRRRSQLLHARPDLQLTDIRGNVDTRIGKLDDGFDAVVLARAGLGRLGIEGVVATPLATDVCLPAVGQGALAIESAAARDDVRELLAVLEHAPTRAAVTAERAFLSRLGGGCLAPVAGYAEAADGTVRLQGAVGDPDGKRLIRDAEQGRDPETVGHTLADRMLAAGGDALLAASRAGG